jgi:tripartite-type tricarboxylate transporter receptor subunit TctC
MTSRRFCTVLAVRQPELRMFGTLRVLAAVLAAIACAASAAAYPDHPVKMIVPYPAGGTTDILARIVAARLEQRLGKPFIVENRSGASGMIGSAAVAQAAPDGHTLVVGTISSHGINASVFKTISYDTVRDFAPVTVIASTPNVLMVHPSLPVRSVAELIEYVQKNPGLNFGSTSTAGSPHMSGELLKTLTRINIQHVPYRGAAPMLNDLLGGHIKMAFDNLPSSMEHIRSGAVRALAVTTTERFPRAPDIPTMAESGVPGYEVAAWFGVLAPAKTPQPVLDLLYRNISEILKEEPIRQRLDALGAVPVGNTPAEFARHIEEEVRKWKDVVAATGVKVE